MGDQPIIVAVLFLEGLLAGLFLGSSLVEHAVRRLDATSWIAYKQAKEKLFGPVMPVLFGATLLGAILVAMLGRQPPHMVAATLLAAVLVITVRVHLPLNRLFEGWSPEIPPPGWSDARRRWRDWNWFRCALAVFAFAAALM